MKSFCISGKISKVEPRTSKASKPYSIVYIEDKDGTAELITGSRVEVPPVGSYVLCSGNIRSTPKQYQDRVFYSYSFLVTAFEEITKFELTESEEISLPEVNFSDSNIPF